MSQLNTVVVPDIGDFDEVEIIEILVKVGDVVNAEQSLITVESDKASMEIPSSHAGIVTEIKVKLGDKVKQGSQVVVLSENTDQAKNTTPATTPAPAATTKTAEPLSAAPATTTPAAPVAGGLIDIIVPDIGDFKEVEVIELLAKVGDTITVDQSLLTVESDKASMEIPSSHAGILKAFKIKLGDKVNKGTIIASIEVSAGTTASQQNNAPATQTTTTTPATAPIAASQTTTATAAPTSAPINTQDNQAFVKAHASPSVRKFARELGVDLSTVKGSASKGRISHEDVRQYVKGVVAQVTSGSTNASANNDGAGLGLIPWPKVDFAKFGEVTTQPLSRLKKISGANLHRNWVMIPHVTNHDECDITELEAFRVLLNKENEKSGIKVTMLAFMIKAAVAALKKFPEFNASIDGKNLVLKQYYHIGFAADTPNGLVVPVIKNADQKGVAAIAQEMSELAKKARDGKLGPAEMTGGTFTISSLGGIGGTYFTPIINAPEVAIMGVCKSSMKPVWNGKEFEPRLMLPLSLSWDHRVIDGAAAARFNAYFGAIMQDFRRVMI